MDWRTEILRRIYRVWTPTLRYTKIGSPIRSAAVIVVWHRKLWGAVPAYIGYDVVGLASQHADANPIVAILRDYGFDAVRGSTTRGGISASIGLIKSLKRNKLVAITPDGPRGPAEHFQKGAWALARALNVPMIFTGIGYSHFIRLRTWDRFELPVPFSRVFVIYEVRNAPSSHEEAGDILKAVTKRAEDMAKRWKVYVQS